MKKNQFLCLIVCLILNNISVQATLKPNVFNTYNFTNAVVAPTTPTTSSVIQPTCAVPTGTIVITTQVGVEYSINNGSTYQSSPTFSGVSPGSYLVVVREISNPAAISNSLTVTINAAPSSPTIPTILAITHPTCSISTGTITLSSQTGVEYSINNGAIYQSSNVFTSLSPGDYIIKVRRQTDNSCTATAVNPITINAVPSCMIDAVTDNLGIISPTTGGTTLSVTANDTLNGIPVTIGINPGNVTLTGTTVPSGLTLNANGTITVAPNTPEGTYNITYTICEVTNPANCDTAVSRVSVFTGANVGVVKTVSNATPNVGSNVTFTITASNAGPDPATNVVVNDVLPSGYTFVSANPSVGSWTSPNWAVGNLANGATATLNLVARVNAMGSYTNTATITATENDPTTSNNSSTSTPIPNAVANVGVTKTVSNLSPNVGSNVSFTIVANNAGPSNATNVRVVDVLPSGYQFVSVTPTVGTWTEPNWNIGNLANGATATLTIVATVKPSGSYANTATITANEINPVSEDDDDTVIPNPIPQGPITDLKVIKTVDKQNPTRGENVIFTITASNDGPNDATNVNVYDYINSGYTLITVTPSVGTWSSSRWNIGNLANGTSKTLTMMARVNAVGSYANTATIDSANEESNSSNNISTVTPQPVGDIFNAQLSNKLGLNANGCDISDTAYPNIKYIINDGNVSNEFITNNSGSRTIELPAGNHTITPVLENPSYFNITPAFINVSFPSQSSPFTQQFCITPNSNYNDLEVKILTITNARPGFNASYKIIYKNKGGSTQNGTLNLVFDDTVLDFVFSNPVVATQITNNLSWEFTNLLPLETREITFELNLNSPQETPPLNSEDILNYTVNINGSLSDVNSSDNTHEINQRVVNSYDPNDKICLEGTTIAPEKVGEYLHYIIRFENEGTANAENVRIEDFIDLSKFDLSTLVPIKGSHSFVTKITNGNKVEFIFENIQLPFEDANNDGFVAFKIKTKSNLVLGNTITNTANIYFDYNKAIETNTYTTTIATLSTNDFEFDSYFKIYPNPVSSVLKLDILEKITVESFTIYNVLGQKVLHFVPSKKINSIDVSNLKSGNYLIRMKTMEGLSSKWFIKE